MRALERHPTSRGLRAAVRISPWVATALVVWVTLASEAAAQAISPEVWVVNDVSRDISIVDDLGDTPGTIETVSLGGALDPLPYGIAFSTIVGSPGDFAFVTQGPDVKAIPAEPPRTPVVSDVAAWLGEARADVRLRGVDTALPERLDDGSPTGILVYRLHVTAEVRPGGAGDWEPWWIVLDQPSLIAGSFALVASGPLLEGGAPVPVPIAAMEATALATPDGSHPQRVWHTWQEPAGAPVLHADLVVRADAPYVPTSPGMPDPHWSVADRVTRQLPNGGELPEGIGVGGAFSRELVLLPTGSDGEAQSLSGAGTCSFGDVLGNVLVAGPGFPNFQIFALKPEPGVAGTVELRRWTNCNLEEVFVVGVQPIDIDTRGRIRWHEAYVANRGSDSVTILGEGNPPAVIGTVELAPPGPGCDKCPRSIAVRERAETICRAQEHTLTLVNFDQDVRHVWTGLGCDANVGFKLWCRCIPGAAMDCPPACQNVCPYDPNLDMGDNWCEVDVNPGDSEVVVEDEGSSQSETTTDVAANDDPPN